MADPNVVNSFNFDLHTLHKKFVLIRNFHDLKPSLFYDTLYLSE
jgi:hypothetical protein